MTSEPQPGGGLSALLAYGGVDAAGGRGLPPVHLWNPPHCGDIDIRIARDGTWFHEGSPIGRAALVRLFSTVLRKDPEGYVLVTPAEKLRIAVDDAPFIAVRVDREADGLRFVTNVGDTVVAGPEHRLRVQTDPQTGEPAPYLHVRAGLEARLARPVFYELAEMAAPREGDGVGRELGVESGGMWFSLGEAA
ncbi:MAG: DUF1285 domain-containing protein [Caulobacteraceae bacterium]